MAYSGLRSEWVDLSDWASGLPVLSARPVSVLLWYERGGCSYDVRQSAVPLTRTTQREPTNYHTRKYFCNLVPLWPLKLGDFELYVIISTAHVGPAIVLLGGATGLGWEAPILTWRGKDNVKDVLSMHFIQLSFRNFHIRKASERLHGRCIGCFWLAPRGIFLIALKIIMTRSFVNLENDNQYSWMMNSRD